MRNTASGPALALPRSRRSRAHARKMLRLIPVYVAVGVGGIVFAIPFYWMLRTAVMPSWQIYVFPPDWIPAQIVLDNFSIPFRIFPFARWFLNTLIVATSATLGATASSAPVGFAFARLRFPLKHSLFVVVLATMMLPQQVRLVPSYLLFSGLGWVNTWLPLIVPQCLAPAFYVFLYRQFFMTIPIEMDEAALIDGCNPLSIFWRIHLPMSIPAMGVVAIFEFRSAWNDLMNPLIYIRRVDQFTLALGLKLFQGHMNVRMQGLMAASLLSILPLIFMFFIAQRQFIQGIVITGVKG